MCVIVSVPACAPAEVGEKMTVIILEAPGGTLTVIDPVAPGAPVRLASETENRPLLDVRVPTASVAVPVFEIVKDCSPDDPTPTAGKVSEVVDKEMVC